MKKVIINILKKVISWLTISLNKAREYGNVVVEVVNGLKAVVDNPALSTAVAFTRTDVDDVILAQVRVAVTIAAKQLLTGHNIIYSGDPLRALVSHLRTLPLNGRIDFLVGIAGRAIHYLADGKLTMAEAIALGQDIYNEWQNRNK